MFLLCLGVHKYSTLVEKARKNLYLPHEEDSYKPGNYDYGAITFKLSKHLIGPSVKSIRGSAIEGNTIAVIPTIEITDEYVWADPVSQSLYKLGKPVHAENGVNVYEAVEVNPLAIFTNLQMKTHADPGYNCSFAPLDLAATCSAWYGLNWDHEQNKPPLKNTSIEGLQYRAGALGMAKGMANVVFDSITSLHVDFDVEFSASAGLGVRLEQLSLHTNLNLGDLNIPIFGYAISILGIKLEIGLNAFIGFQLKDIGVDMPDPLEYYRSVTAKLSKHGTVNTKGDFVTDPWRFNIQTNMESTLPHNISDFMKTAIFTVEPEISLGAKISFSIGRIIQSELKVGGGVDMTWKFSADKDKCTFPYLYGTTQTNLITFFRGHPLKLFGWDLLPPFDFTWPIYRGDTSPKHCIFSAEHSQEGSDEFLFNETADAIVVKPKYVYPMPDFCLEADPTYSVRLDAYAGPQSTHPFKSVQLNAVSFEPYAREGERNLTNVMVLTNPPVTTVFRYHVVTREFVFNLEPFNLDHGSAESCAQYSNFGLCIHSEIDATNSVDPFKEFTSDNGNMYLAFDPPIANFSTYGLITHTNKDAYSAPLAGFNALDDSITSQTDAYRGEYTYGKQLTISLEHLHQSSGKTTGGVVWFYRCMNEECEQIGRFDISAMDKDATAKQLGCDLFTVPFDLTRPYDLKIELELKHGDKVTTKVLKCPNYYFEDYDDDFVKVPSLEAGAYEATLQFRRNQPRVLFNIDPEYAFKGIVSRVFQPEQTFDNKPLDLDFEMNETEIYGIARFFIPAQKALDSKDYWIIITSENIVPLCEHMWLGFSHTMVKIVQGETLFTADHQTEYFDNVNTVHIPFRRKSSEAANCTITLEQIIKATNDGICSTNQEIDNEDGQTLTGCVERRSPGEEFVSEWVVRPSTAEHTIVDYPEENWRLHQFKTDSKKVQMVMNKWEIYSNKSSTFIDRSFVSGFNENKERMKIACPRCDRVRVVFDGLTEYAAKVDGQFEYVPSRPADLVLVPECDDSTEAYCEFTEDFESYTFVTYDDETGVRPTESSAFRSGIQTQIVHGKSKGLKTWKGKINRLHTLEPSPLMLFLKDENELALSFGGLSIPFGIQRYADDPEAFFAALGIQRGEGYNAATVNFTSCGQVFVAPGKWNMPEETVANAAKFVDLPESMITSFNVIYQNTTEDDPLTPQPKSSNTTKIIICSVAGAAGVCIIVCISIFVVRRKAQRHFDSSPMLMTIE